MLTTPVVYVPSEPCRFDSFKQCHVPIYDLTPAEEFGCIQRILPNGAPPVVDLFFQKCSKIMERAKDTDHILCIGDPVVIFLAASALAGVTGGKVNLLRWDRFKRGYISVPVNISNSKGE